MPPETAENSLEEAFNDFAVKRLKAFLEVVSMLTDLSFCHNCWAFQAI